MLAQAPGAENSPIGKFLARFGQALPSHRLVRRQRRRRLCQFQRAQYPPLRRYRKNRQAAAEDRGYVDPPQG
jgi:hypothetical protein